MHEPLLLLPGMMCDARLFSPQLEYFCATRPVMVSPLTGRSTIEKLAQDILLHAPPQFALAGLSMGGITAMEIVRQAPARVTRLALLDTNHLAESKERALAREPQIEKVLGGGLRAVMRDEMKPNYLTDGPRKQSILDLCMTMSEALGPPVFVEQSRALQTRPDQTETLKTISVPALVLCGEDDTLCPVERHVSMHNLISGSKLVVLEQAGHLPTLEQANRTNQELDRWLNL